MNRQQIAPKAPVVQVAGLEPVAVEGCAMCAAQVEQRETARKVANTAKVRNCNKELVNHPHSEIKGPA